VVPGASQCPVADGARPFRGSGGETRGHGIWTDVPTVSGAAELGALWRRVRRPFPRPVTSAIGGQGWCRGRCAHSGTVCSGRRRDGGERPRIRSVCACGRRSRRHARTEGPSVRPAQPSAAGPDRRRGEQRRASLPKAEVSQMPTRSPSRLRVASSSWCPGPPAGHEKPAVSRMARRRVNGRNRSAVLVG
jgi:hypothetical protein